MKVITLQRPADCADCGVHLPAGTRARYYSADRIYCETHDEPPPGGRQPGRHGPLGAETDSLFQDDSLDPLIQFLEEVKEALTNLIGRLRG